MKQTVPLTTPPESKNRAMFRLANLTSIGIGQVMCTLIGYGIGYSLDKWLDKKPIFSLVFLMFGIGAGFLNTFRMIKKYGD